MTASNATACLLPDNQRHFGRYTLLCRFAVGGMASLYLARLKGPEGFNKPVAIKIMHQHLCNDPEFVKMFIDEARLASRISHPNVVQILELGRIGPSHFIAMEYVEGECVLDLLRRTKPSYLHCARIIADAAAGLHAVHELTDSCGRPLDVVHRDLSPDNLLISYGGTVKVADFGVARAQDSLHTTSAGSLKGKFCYMAPEQAAAQPIDRRVDIFALGIVLYEMITHRRLFRRGTDSETLQAVLRCQVPPPSRQVEDCPKDLEQVVRKALRPDPDQRYQTAQEMQEELERFLMRFGEPVLPTAVGHMMADVFADRIDCKRKQLGQFLEEDSDEVPVLTLPEIDSGSLPVVSGVAPRQWPRILGWALILLLITAGLSFMLGLRQGARIGISEAMPLTAAPAAREVQTVTFAALAGHDVCIQHVEQPTAHVIDARKGADRGRGADRCEGAQRASRARETRRAKRKGREATLVLITEPPTDVFLGRRHLGRTPINAELATGRLRLNLTNEQLGLRVERRLRLRRSGMKAHWIFGKGSIRFRVPPGRHIQVDGKTLGLTPIPPMEAWEGRHDVAVTHPFRYERQRFTVTVRQGRTTWVSQGN